jgi:hypothetical protein
LKQPKHSKAYACNMRILSLQHMQHHNRLLQHLDETLSETLETLETRRRRQPWPIGGELRWGMGRGFGRSLAARCTVRRRAVS